MSKIDYLTEDSNLPTGQNFLCLSLLFDKTKSSQDTMHSKLKAVKVRGIFKTYELACTQAKHLRSVDETSDVFVAECGKWLGVDPDRHYNDTQKLTDELNNMMKQYMESHENNKLVHDRRKNIKIINNLVDNLNIRQKNMEDIKTKMSEMKDDDMKNSTLESLKTMEQEIKKLEIKKVELETQNNNFNKQLGNTHEDIEINMNVQSTETKDDAETVVNNDVNLSEDNKYVCLSFLSDKDNKKLSNSKLLGIKVRGGFNTEELAGDHAKYLQSVDEYFHVFVGESGKWLPFDPNPDTYAKKSEYGNEQLNSMMKGYTENQEKAKIFNEQRKQETIRNSLLDNLNNNQQNLKDIKNKIKKSKNPTESKNLEQSIKSIEATISKMESEKNNLNDMIKDLSNKVGSFPKGEMIPPKIINTDE